MSENCLLYPGAEEDPVSSHGERWRQTGRTSEEIFV